MADRAKIAWEFVDEQLARRSDILGAMIFGSVARGEATATSDIDIAIDLAGDPGEGKRGLSCWREGVFLEAGFVAADSVRRLDEVMRSPIDATHLNDALVLHDPTGRFTALQREVRAAFMEPRWLVLRLGFALAVLAGARAALRVAIAAGDVLGILRQAMMVTQGAASVPLYRCGITPSSTRKLAMLHRADPAMRDVIVEFECSLRRAAFDAEALVRACEGFLDASDRPDLGGLTEYMAWKARHAIADGAVDDGIDMLWCAAGMSAPREASRGGACEPARRWLDRVGWSGAAAISEKERLAMEIESRAREMAGDDAIRAGGEAAAIVSNVVRRSAPD
jgi:predicted nucleotidyltransferase